MREVGLVMGVGECVAYGRGVCVGVVGGWIGWRGGMKRRDGRGRQGGCQWGRGCQWVVGCMALGGQGTYLGLGGTGLGLDVSGCGCPLPVFAGWRLGGG